ncbi:RecB family exonuclease [Hymenobacter psychrotolerans]|uniref:PD-(D/E)XK nuclease superfamily protein n=1 Tax=Hymenobacter psychrotolerans DSM 18569 TaxID=1121959 RepID=A0A1M7EFR2_9BACT|nr:PD-(D/E)XK nuclease family protein [Hymenobacter psychrotolerans]SHL90625.1 PD-(D/E)XK nuclease superfamily protein [Hymenobacter psychrotolerans DSM 18569]
MAIVEKQWRLSPSQFGQVQQCGYRHLLKLADALPLPTSGAAVLGVVMHGMLGTHASHPFSSTAGFDAEWQRQVDQQETQLLADPVTAGLVPLAQTVRKYAIKKATLRRSLVGTMSLSTPSRIASSVGAASSSGAKLGAEVWLAAGRIAGRADLIRQGVSGVEIVDYKTGYYAATESSGLPIAKPEYAQQLQLYAALYHAETTIWPTRGLLIGLAGGEVAVPFTPADCLSVLAGANQMLDSLEQAARLGTGLELARPAPETCRFCSYRLNCHPYLLLLHAAGGAIGADVLGALGRTTATENRLNLTIVTSTGPIVIQAAGRVANRLNGEAIAGSGQWAVVSGVRQTPGSRTFTAEPTAVIRIVEEFDNTSSTSCFA